MPLEMEMDPPGVSMTYHNGEEQRKPPPSSSISPTHSQRRESTIGSRYIRLIIALSFICFVVTALVYNRILAPYSEVMSLSIDQPLIFDNNHNSSLKLSSIEDQSVDDIIINQPLLRDGDNSSANYLSSTKSNIEEKYLPQHDFQPTAFHKHIHLRQSNYIHHDNFNHSLKSTFGTGQNSNIRISFQLHDPKTVPIENRYNPHVTCPIGKITAGKGLRRKPTGENRDGVLPPSLSNVIQSAESPRAGRVLNFTATISTNLKILQIGDSVEVQLAQTFDEMVGCRSTENGTRFCRPRYVLWETWSGHDGRSIMWHTIGGGVSALWRMTGLLSRSMEGKAPANSHGGGWSMGEVMSFLHHYTPVGEVVNNTDVEYVRNNTVQRFDAVVFRVMHGWMKSAQITHERLVEAVELSHELLGTETVILMTIPFTNNVVTVDEMDKVNRINADIRDIAQGWHLRNSTGVKHVLVQEYGTYHNHIIWSNARHIGYNVSAPLMMTNEMFDVEGPTFLYDRLETGKQWAPSIPQICSERDWLHTEKAKCNRNYLISDGMHICPETLATRHGVSVACLLGCVYNREPGVDDQHQRDESNLRECERECNEQFMSVMPVDESWIDSNTEIASIAAPYP